MPGKIELAELIKEMTPHLFMEEYVFVSMPVGRYGDCSTLEPIASFVEEEGLTLIVPRAAADEKQLEYASVFNKITLSVHSSLDAVGFLATIAEELSKVNISCNVISAYYHDHLFVHVKDSTKAYNCLTQLSESYQKDS
ncbi:ACT domain-containing protein [Pleionea sp. CnH1-48]|uniref:ACT domain-containing protein n=1 Tax=Pleionea sp. CnH1-48 TaxID=2954494 RepID=UPI002097FF42|nr:ACT domain-containing protein [Pleionea sp. CnH1-48]MCO7227052.1 ACT domain-containing protein [Pleionea sp. CnH1-48]